MQLAKEIVAKRMPEFKGFEEVAALAQAEEAIERMLYHFAGA